MLVNLALDGATSALHSRFSPLVVRYIPGLLQLSTDDRESSSLRSPPHVPYILTAETVANGLGWEGRHAHLMSGNLLQAASPTPYALHTI